MLKNQGETHPELLQISHLINILFIYITRLGGKEKKEKEKKRTKQESSDNIPEIVTLLEHTAISLTRTRQFCNIQVNTESNPPGCISLLTSNPTSYATVLAQKRRDSTLHSKQTFLFYYSSYSKFSKPTRMMKVHANK